MTDKIITSYKAFDKNWKCRDFQFEIGKLYEHDGDVEVCKSGFHACKYPLDVFKYYAASSSKFAVVQQSGQISEQANDSKVASKKITIVSELDITGLVKAAIDYNFAKKEKNTEHVTGQQEVAIATDIQGVASATGYAGAAIATSYNSAAMTTATTGSAINTGDNSAAAATGYLGSAITTSHNSVAIATSMQGVASATGQNSVALACGYKSKALAVESSAICLVYRDVNEALVHIRASKVGENGIRPNVWYSLDADGNFVEVACNDHPRTF